MLQEIGGSACHVCILSPCSSSQAGTDFSLKLNRGGGGEGGDGMGIMRLNEGIKGGQDGRSMRK